MFVLEYDPSLWTLMAAVLDISVLLQVKEESRKMEKGKSTVCSTLPTSLLGVVGRDGVRSCH